MINCLLGCFSTLKPKFQHGGVGGAGEEEKETKESKSAASTSKSEVKHRPPFQAEQGRQRHPIRRPGGGEGLRRAAGLPARAAAAPQCAAARAEPAPEPPFPLHDHVRAHQLHRPGAARMAHPHARARRAQVQARGLHLRVRGHEVRRRPAVAGRDPAGEREQAAGPRARRLRVGEVQAPQREPDVLRVCGPTSRSWRVWLRRRSKKDS